MIHRSVVSRDDKFGLCGVQMGAPIGDNAIGTVRCIASSTISNDGIMRRFNWQFVQGQEHGALWRETGDTVGRAELFGVVSGENAATAAFGMALITFIGNRIRRIPSVPIPPVESALPRCGVETKMTRLTSGLAENISACFRVESAG